MTTDLTVSTDGHYLLRNGEPFQYTAENLWYLPLRATRGNVDVLLDGLGGVTDPDLGCTNVIQLCIVMNNFTHPSDENPPNMYSHRPFNDTGGVPDFADPLIVSGGTPDAPNDFWDHMDYIMREIDNHDMHVLILPFWSKAYLRDAYGWGFTEIPVADCRAFGEFLGDRYKGYDNVLWLLGGDGFEPVVNGHVPHYRALAEGILKGTTGCTTCPSYNDDDPLWDATIMSYHADRYEFASDHWGITDRWCNTDGIYSGRWHLYAGAYDLADPRPIFETEGYGLWISTDEQAARVRGHHYIHMLQGGRGIMYMNENVWEIAGDWETRLSNVQRNQFVILRDFIRGFEWWNFIPDNTIILSSNSPSEANYLEKMVSSRSSDEDTIVVYFGYHTPKTAQIDLNAITTNTTIHGTWMYPKDGTIQSAGTHDVDDNPTFAVPTGWEDGLLKLQGTAPYTRYRGILRQKPQYNMIGGRFR